MSSTQSSIVSNITKSLEKWCLDNKLPDDHGMVHFLAVTENAKNALKDTVYKESIKTNIILASLLHDCDDPKIKKFITVPMSQTNSATNTSLTTTFPEYPIARSFLKDLPKDDVEHVILMISYVSTSKNGDREKHSFSHNEGSTLIPSEMASSKVPLEDYIPGDCDRVEALGVIGIERCFDVTQRLKNPIFTSKTPLPIIDKELEEIIKARPLEDYVKKQGRSDSMIDHFFDKLLQLKPRSNNPHVAKLFENQMMIMKKWLFKTCDYLRTQDVKTLDYESFKKTCLSSSFLQVKSSKSLKLIGEKYPGLNIEGGYPGQDFKGVWANAVLILDCPLAGKGNFDELQKKVYKMREASLSSTQGTDNKIVLLESGVEDIDERSFLSFQLALISYYLEKYTSLAIWIHQMPPDAKELIKLLSGYVNRMKKMMNREGSTITFYHDDPYYRKGDLLKMMGKHDILISLSQCAGLSSSSIQGAHNLKAGTFIIPNAFIPFDVKTNTIYESKKYQVNNSLIDNLDKIDIKHYSIADKLLQSYISSNPEKKFGVDKPNIIKGELLQVADIWNPTSPNEIVHFG